MSRDGLVVKEFRAQLRDSGTSADSASKEGTEMVMG